MSSVRVPWVDIGLDRGSSVNRTRSRDFLVRWQFVRSAGNAITALLALGVLATVPAALARREQLMESRESRIEDKGGRGGREAVHALV